MKKASVLAAIIAAALLLCSCSIFISTKSLTDSGDYPDIFDDKYDLEISRDQRGVFPEDINGAEDCDFDFQYTDTLVAADYVIFLRCKYSESDFLAEKERVSAVSVDSLDESAVSAFMRIRKISDILHMCLRRTSLSAGIITRCLTRIISKSYMWT